MHCSDITNKKKQDSVIKIQNTQPKVELSREQQIAELEEKLYTKNQELKLKMKEYKQLQDNNTLRMCGATVVGLIPAALIPPATPFTLAAALFVGVPFTASVGGTHVYNNSQETKFYDTQILPLKKEIKELETKLSLMYKFRRSDLLIRQ